MAGNAFGAPGMFNGYDPYNTGMPDFTNPYRGYTNPYDPYNTGRNRMQNGQNMQDSNMQWIYVNGIEGARNVMVSPNQTAYMMSQSSNEFYVKAVDNMGVAVLKAYRFQEFDPNAEAQQIANAQNADYVSRNEYNQFVNNVSNQLAMIQQNLTTPAALPLAQTKASGGRKSTSKEISSDE